MKRPNSLWPTGICAMACLLGAAHWFRTKPIYAQQSTQSYNDGTFYISASVDVDSSYNLRVDSYMEVEFDSYEDIDSIEVDGSADEDGGSIGGGATYGDDYDPAEVLLNSSGPVATGHEYGMESDGYACYDDGEGSSDCEYVGTAYAFVDVGTAAPQITSISPSSVQQGDQGTLTIDGTNLVENATDQLTLNYSGSGMPFTLTGTRSSTQATFSYDFSGYDTGTYQISVTNNEGTSNQVNFTVNPPQNACSQATTPNAVTLTINALASKVGSFTISHPTAIRNGATTTVSYGPNSTPSSIASSIAASIVKNYGTLGITAQSAGSSVTIQSRSTFGSLSYSASDGVSSVNIGIPSSVSCLVRSPQQLCFGFLPKYDVVQPYDGGRTQETAEQHIIRRHIDSKPTQSPLKTIYIPVNPGDLPSLTFEHVVSYNFTTVFYMPFPKNGFYTHTFPKYQTQALGGYYDKGFIGVDAAGNDLYINELRLTSDRCRVRTSYPGSIEPGDN